MKGVPWTTWAGASMCVPECMTVVMRCVNTPSATCRATLDLDVLEIRPARLTQAPWVRQVVELQPILLKVRFGKLAQVRSRQSTAAPHLYIRRYKIPQFGRLSRAAGPALQHPPRFHRVDRDRAADGRVSAEQAEQKSDEDRADWQPKKVAQPNRSAN